MAREASALIKEFKMNDLRRMRNLKDGRLFDSTVTQKGYEKEEVRRKEGDVFEENGKTYIIKDGIKKKFSKLTVLRGLIKVPLFCPCCNKPLSKNIDQRMYNIKKMCLDCNIDFEAKLKKEGKFKEYQANFMSENYRAELIDFKQYLIDFVGTQSNIMNSEGVVEEWSTSKLDITDMITSIDNELSEL